MPRPRTHSREALVEKAMLHFWHHGYEATSMDDLVQSTKVSRHGLYGEFSGKQELFAACLDAYSHLIVSPAFTQVEGPHATLQTIASYFDYQITRAEKSEIPLSGCLIANTMTELAPHDGLAAEKVGQHNLRLHNGFLNALRNSVAVERQGTSPENLNGLAMVLVTFTNGLWSMSRTIPDPQALRRIARDFLNLIERSIKS
jgi:TetR/AcrR family transcriptional regulator, transcriptional repressor for nem operon